MQVVLRSDVEKVGLRGEVVDVAPGFARNYLIPRKLADLATPALIAEVQRVEERRARHEAKDFEHAQEIAQRIESRELRFDVSAGPTGTLFGSVTATDVADELWRGLKVRVDRRKIELADPIKRVGRYEVPVEVFTDVTATARLAVVPEGDELPPEEELEAAEAAERAEAEAAEARAAEVHEEAERAVEEFAAAEEAEAEAAAEEQVPEDAFDRASDAAVETPSGEEPQGEGARQE
jgi:large subunit ribosomal protein L9